MDSVNKNAKKTAKGREIQQKILTKTLELLESDGYRSLSLRKVAKAAGLSHNAPYMHFPNQKALLEAAAVQGFSLLSKALRAAIDHDISQKEAFFEASWAYIQFHASRPQLSTLMFSLTKEPGTDLWKAAGKALEILIEQVRENMAGQNWEEEGIVAEARFLWTLMHGHAVLFGSQGDKALWRVRWKRALGG
jgi:AcrR family transcriptional regulator